MRVAIGLKARIGRAALVIVGGDARAPLFVESREVKLGWNTHEIIAVHVRMHVAEGELFRNVLVALAQ